MDMSTIMNMVMNSTMHMHTKPMMNHNDGSHNSISHSVILFWLKSEKLAVNRPTAGLAMNFMLGLRHNFCCRGPI